MSFLNLEKGPSICRLEDRKKHAVQDDCGDFLTTNVPSEIVSGKLGYRIPGELCRDCLTTCPDNESTTVYSIGPIEDISLRQRIRH